MSLTSVKRVLIGMNRPTEEEITNLLLERGISSPYFWCPCFPPDVSGHVGSFIPHLLSGHYDKPVYKYVFEEDGKVIESLEPPNDNIGM